MLVSAVFKIFKLKNALGCKVVESPKERIYKLFYSILIILWM
jgi:hypothetical protein